MNIINIIENLNLVTVFKIMLAIGLSLYSFFAFLISRQIRIMNKAVSTKYGSYLYVIGLIHLAFALFVLFLSIITI